MKEKQGHSTNQGLRWNKDALMDVFQDWYAAMSKKNATRSERSSWWPFSSALQSSDERARARTECKQNQMPSHLMNTNQFLDTFIAGEYRFSPMRKIVSTPNYNSSNTLQDPKDKARHDLQREEQRKRADTHIYWDYHDRLALRLLFKTIQPTFDHIISPYCMHLNGPRNVKHFIQDVKDALETDEYSYVIRFDIAGYYASIDRDILMGKIKEHFDDQRIIGYMQQIINHITDDDAILRTPEKGIPMRSTLSPFFGALYLSELDQIMGRSTGVFYRRWMDDAVILTKTKKQYIRAKRLLSRMLKELKLQFSKQKTKMGHLSDFHALGVQFDVSRNSSNKSHVVTLNIHPRSCCRSVNKVLAKMADAENTADIQAYIARSAAWWARVSGLPAEHFVRGWINVAAKVAPLSIQYGITVLLRWLVAQTRECSPPTLAVGS